MIIIGIDPGLARTGWGVIRKTKNNLKYLDCGVLATEPSELVEARLRKLHLGLLKIITKHQPKILAVESLYFFKNLKTALPVSEAKGVILLAAARKKIPVEQLTPLQVKLGVCGYGRAEKPQVQEMITKVLHLKKTPKPSHAADALAVAVCWAGRDSPHSGTVPKA